MTRCLRTARVEQIAASATGAELVIRRDTRAFTVRAVDNAGTPAQVAFTVRNKDEPTGPRFDFRANEAWTERDLQLTEDWTVVVTSVAGFIQLIRWE